jgi:predicted glycogen debranching enzyme
MTLEQEWLEADGLGGFASGTARGVRTRRYHGVLLAATTPPTGRVMLVNGVEAWVSTPEGRLALTTHRYAPGVDHPDGASRLRAFTIDPWPTWTWDIGAGRTITGELLVTHGAPRTVLTWTLHGSGPVHLEVRPLLSGRDYHALHHENGAFDGRGGAAGAELRWQPYDGLPLVRCLSTGSYQPALAWFRQFLYDDERARGLDDVEDLASPGVLTFALADGPALCVFEAGDADVPPPCDVTGVRRLARGWITAERRRRRAFATEEARAADAYLVRRGEGTTIIAGYPWFTDWGRDTFIALRGLCLASGRHADARDVLIEWAGAVDRGMLPNRFPDAGAEPEFNAVDASLWFVVAAGELLAATSAGRIVTRGQRSRLHQAMQAILEGYSGGTRFGIRADDDGLLAAGEPGQQLTWMDARAGGREVTPRIGKPVEVQALWINALAAGATIDARWQERGERARTSFTSRFWNPARAMLYDVVDVDHEPGRVDDAFRPNQILAAGGLPERLVTGERARAMVDAVERHLWTPLGLRTLAPGEPGYTPRYEGSPDVRDAAYHQGTAWPWLLDPFVDAWIAVRGDTGEARRDARARFVAPLDAWRRGAGLGHVPEIADGDAPHRARGRPFQAWSLSALLRMEGRTR